MKEVDANKQAWGKLSEQHFQTFRRRLAEGSHRFNPYIQRELGDLSGKSVIHLQCNTGADTILLARMAAHATGVDLVPDNVRYARLLAAEAGAANTSFIESDIMRLMDTHSETYDAVFVSEGAVGWLPDLARWGRTIRHLLKEGGFVYVFDSHPFFLMLNTDKLAGGKVDIQYPYFAKQPDRDDTIGGYAAPVVEGAPNYFWMYTVSDLIDSLTQAGLQVEYFHEYPENFFDPGGLQNLGNGLFNYPFNTGKFPMTFSLRATVQQWP